MLLTEDEIGTRAGLPGPVVAELLQPRIQIQTGELAAARDPQYRAEDALRAKVAAHMFAIGIRWRFVQAAIAALPDDQAALHQACWHWALIPPALGAVVFRRGLRPGWAGWGEGQPKPLRGRAIWPGRAADIPASRGHAGHRHHHRTRR